MNCKKKVNNDVTLTLKPNFLGQIFPFPWQQLSNKCFKTVIRHLIQILQLMLNLIELGN